MSKEEKKETKKIVKNKGKKQKKITKEDIKKKKEKKVEEDRLLTQLTKKHQAEAGLQRKLFYTLFGLVTSLLPAYFFQSIRGLDLTESVGAILALSVTIVSTWFLAESYHSYFFRTKLVLKKSYDQIVEQNRIKLNKFQRGVVNVEQESVTELGSTGYGIFFGNTLYLTLFLLLSSYILKNTDMKANYLFSTVISAFVTYWVSKREIKRKK